MKKTLHATDPLQAVHAHAVFGWLTGKVGLAAKPNIKALPVVALLLFATWTLPASGATIFADNFNAGASPLWSSQRGNWTATGGAYYAQAPSNGPLTDSLVPYSLTDFTVDVDVKDPTDGGIYLRSNADASQAVLLLIGGMGHSGTGLYWHIGPNFSTIVNPSPQGLFTHNDDIHLRVVVSGNTYSAYLNNSLAPVTTLVYGGLSSGQVGLYDFTGAGGGQSFDNFVVSTAGAATPEGSTAWLSLLGFALVAVGKLKRRR